MLQFRGQQYDLTLGVVQVIGRVLLSRLNGLRIVFLYLLLFQGHLDIFGKVGGNICRCGCLRVLEWVQRLLVKATSCKLTQLLPLNRVGFRGLVVLALRCI
jgi:hypothetical protein